MQDLALIGINLGKHSFHVHGQDRQGKALLRSMLTRRHSNGVACALANKLARTAWAKAAHHTEFKRQEAVMMTAS